MRRDAHGAAQRSRFDDLDRLDVADLDSLVVVVLLDIPGVVGARFVDEAPELIAAIGEHIAIARLSTT